MQDHVLDTVVNIVVCNSSPRVIALVPGVARHLDLKVQHSTKEEDVWEDCHDASLLAWGWFMGTSCMACGVLTMWHNCVRPLVHI